MFVGFVFCLLVCNSVCLFAFVFGCLLVYLVESVDFLLCLLFCSFVSLFVCLLAGPFVCIH